MKCEKCGVYYNADNHEWSDGYGCKFFCSKKCCDDDWLNKGGQESNIPSCPCY